MQSAQQHWSVMERVSAARSDMQPYCERAQAWHVSRRQHSTGVLQPAIGRAIGMHLVCMRRQLPQQQSVLTSFAHMSRTAALIQEYLQFGQTSLYRVPSAQRVRQ